MVDFGKRLKDLRESSGLTQKQVAERVGVTSAVISAYETGIRQPSYAVLVKLAALYNVSSDYLLGISDSRTRESRHLVSLDGLSSSNAALVIQLIDALRE